MVKQKLEAGAMLDFVSPEELRTTLDDLVHALGKGVKFRSLVKYWDVANNQVTDTTGIGPENGYIWDVRYVHTDASTAAVPGTTLVYVGGIAPVNLVNTQANNPNTPGTYFNKQVILHSGENLIFQTSGATIAAPIQLATRIHVIEVPIFHEGQLLL